MGTESYTKTLYKLQVGEKIAWDELYTKSRSNVFSFVLRNSGDQNDAADILQSGIMVLHSKIQSKSFKFTSQPSTFVYMICKNLWLMSLRKRKLDTISLNEIDKIEEVVTEIEILKEERLNLIGNKLRNLDEMCRKILTLYYFENLKMDEIAINIGAKNSETVKVQKYRCLKKLKQSCR